jgi:hypothetical protein
LQRHVAWRAAEKRRRQDKIREGKEHVLDVLTAVRTCRKLCEQYGEDESWQDPEMKAIVRESAEIWKDAREQFPDYT